MKREQTLGKRIWASVEKSYSQVVSELFDEAYQSDPKPCTPKNRPIIEM